MPTTLHTVSENNISVRYEAPLLSRDINQKIVAAMPHGIYRGFKLDTSTSVLTVDVEVDPVHGDSMAVIETLDGFGISVKITGAVPLDLSAYTTKTVVIAMFGEYTVGSDTTAVIRAYELYPTDEFTIASELNELVVLGQVVVPGSGLIGATAITPNYRTSSWEHEAPERVQWIPLLKDPMFLTAEDGYEIEDSRYWKAVHVSGAGSFEHSTLGSPVFGQKTISVRVSTSPWTGHFYQTVDAPVAPGQYYYIELYYRPAVSFSSGTLSIKLTFDDADISGPVDVTHTIDLSAIVAGWNHLRFSDRVPATGSLQFLRRIRFDVSGAGPATAQCYLDAFQVFLEALPADLARNAGTILDRICADQAVLVPEAATLDAPGHLFKIDADVLLHLHQRTLLKNKQFATGQVELGADLGASGSLAALPRVDAPAATGTQYTLLWQSEASAGNPVMRWYVDGTGVNQGSWVITFNARWVYTGPVWNEDDAAETPRKFVFGRYGLEAFYVNSGTGTWSDTGWLVSELTLPSIIGNLGANEIGSAAEAAQPRIEFASRTGTYTLLMESGPVTRKMRVYVNSVSGLVFTINAEWTGTVWQADDTGVDARFLHFYSNGLNAKVKAQPHAGTWADAGWDDDVIDVLCALENIGGNLVGSTADAAKPRLQLASRSATYTLLIESGPSTPKMRLYTASNSAFVVTFNALWDGGAVTWGADLSTIDARYVEITNNGLNARVKNQPHAGSWSDSTWDKESLRVLNTIEDLGFGVVGTAAEASIPRIHMSAYSGNYTCLLEGGTATEKLRLYTDSSSRFVITYNAQWDGTDWTADRSTADARKLIFGATGMTARYKAQPHAGSWLDTAWDTEELAFPSVISGLGSDLIGTNLEAETARIDIPSRAATFTLLLYTGVSGSNEYVRVYATSGGGLAITNNARWNSGTNQWIPDDVGGNDAFKFVFGSSGLESYRQAAPPAAWTDGNWEVPPVLVTPSVMELGSSVVSNDTFAAFARLSPRVRAGSYTLLIEPTGMSGDRCRLYKGASDELVITHNAKWDGADWNADDTGVDAWKYMFQLTGLNVYRKDVTTIAWLDSAWDTVPTLWSEGQLWLGNAIQGSPTLAAEPRLILQSANAATYTSLIEAAYGTGSASQARLYASPSELVITYNARWNGTSWTADDSSDDAHKYIFGVDGIKTQWKSAATSWSDAGWDSTPIDFTGPTYMTLSGRLEVGSGLADTALNAGYGRLKVPTSATGYRTLVLEAGYIRLYCESAGDPELFLTINARWDGVASNYVPDDITRASFAVRAIGLGNFQFWDKAAISPSTTFTTWDRTGSDVELTLLGTGCRWTLDDGYVQLVSASATTGTNDPGSTTVIKNELRARNIVKGYVKIQTDGVGGAVVFPGSDFNVSSVSIGGSGITSYARIVWNQDFADDDYNVQVADYLDASGFWNYAVDAVALGTTDIRLVAGNGGTASMDAVQTNFYVLVIGTQN